MGHEDSNSLAWLKMAHVPDMVYNNPCIIWALDVLLSSTANCQPQFPIVTMFKSKKKIFF